MWLDHLPSPRNREFFVGTRLANKPPMTQKTNPIHTSRLRWLIAAGTVAAGVALLVWAFVLPPVETSFQRDRLQPTIGPLRLLWQPDTTYVYLARYHSQEQKRLFQINDANPARDLHGEVDLQTEVHLTLQEQRADRYLLRLGFREVDHYEVTIDGHQFRNDDARRAQITTNEAILDITESGEILGLHFNNTDPELFRTTAQMIAQEFQLRFATSDDVSWTTEEKSARGATTSHYRILGKDTNGSHHVTKHRNRYHSLRGIPWLSSKEAKNQALTYNGAAKIAASGHLDSLRFREQLRVGAITAPLLLVQTSGSLTLIRMQPSEKQPAIALAKRSLVKLDDVIWSEAAAKEALRARTDGLTWEQVVSGVLAASGPSRAQAKWLWRTTGLLRLHPELTYKFLDLFAHEDISDDSRVVILELLGATGHTEAQDVMRQLLSTDTAKQKDLVYTRLVQTVSKLRVPNTDTAAFIGTAYDDAQGIAKTATSYALSSVVARLDAHEHQGLRNELSQRLVSDYHQATTEDQRGTLLVAIAATNMPENVTMVTNQLATASPRVRAMAATGLRFAAATEQRDEALLRLTRDEDIQVQKSALQTLENLPTDQQTLRTVAQSIVSGVIAPSSYYQSLPMMKQLLDDDLRHQVLAHMLTHAPDDAQLRARIQKAGTL